MRVCGTGSEGFIGRYIVDKFSREGHEVIGIDNLSKYGRTKPMCKYRLIIHDLTHPKTIQLMQKLDCDLIIDLAEDVGGTTYLHKQGFHKIQTSLAIRHNILSSCQITNARYMCISTSSLYESVQTFPTSEIPLNELPCPQSPYALSKFNAEYLTKLANVNFVIVRLFNAAGIGDDCFEKAHVIPHLVHKIKHEKSIKLHGDGKQVRNFTHCKDIADALYIVSSSAHMGETFNIGSHNTYDILTLCEKISNKLNINKPIETSTSFSYDVNKSEPDISKLLNIGYNPAYDMDMILDEAIQYYE